MFCALGAVLAIFQTFRQLQTFGIADPSNGVATILIAPSYSWQIIPRHVHETPICSKPKQRDAGQTVAHQAYICTIGTQERSPAVNACTFVLGKPATHFLFKAVVLSEVQIEALRIHQYGDLPEDDVPAEYLNNDKAIA
jgi:hypothetical protein